MSGVHVFICIMPGGTDSRPLLHCMIIIQSTICQTPLACLLSLQHSCHTLCSHSDYAGTLASNLKGSCKYRSIWGSTATVFCGEATCAASAPRRACPAVPFSVQHPLEHRQRELEQRSVGLGQWSGPPT